MFKEQLKKILAYLLITVVVIFLSGILTFYSILNDWNKAADPKLENEQSQVNVKKEFNLLLLGADKGRDGQARSDTLMLMHLDLIREEISLLSIPRDTRVEFANGEYHKINAAYSYGGVELVEDTVSQFLDIKIDYYLQMDYNNFIDIVNLIDGIKLDIAKDLAYVDKAADLDIDLAAGEQMLNGNEALDYVRFRHDYLGDIGRVKRQQKFLQAVADKVFSPAGILKMPQLLNKIRTSIETDFDLSNLLGVAELIKDFDFREIKTATLPGKAGYIEGISYWLVDQERINDILVQFD
ncbi:MAG: LCP family protein [Halanaerobacter sp.]